MRLPIRVWAGLYGLAFHLVALAVVVWVAVRNRSEIPASFWWMAAPAFLVAAFVIYAIVVGPYLAKRPNTRGAFFYDCVIGMLAETGIVALTSILYALAASTRALEAGFGAYLSAAANAILFAFLMAIGSFFVQILVVGNAAGVVGFWVMRKVNARRGATPA